MPKRTSNKLKSKAYNLLAVKSKQILSYYLLAALLLVACDREMGEPGSVVDDNTIGFNANTSKTRADQSDLERDGFSVWGGYVNTDGTAQQVFMGTDVTYDATDGWGYSPARYWNPGKTYTFFGIYPRPDDDEVKPYISDGKVYHTLDFELPTTAGTDLLVATPAPVTATRPYPTVGMEFTHALSKININVQKNGANEEDEVIVRAVAINNVKRAGTYNSETGLWGATSNGSFSFTNLNVALSASEQTLVVGDKMLLPQTIEANSIQLSIMYSIKVGNTTDSYTANADLPNTIISEWEPQKIYTYNVVLGAAKNDILFGIPTVQDWKSDVPVGGSIMIQ